jgi:hypothetical protein
VVISVNEAIRKIDKYQDEWKKHPGIKTIHSKPLFKSVIKNTNKYDDKYDHFYPEHNYLGHELYLDNFQRRVFKWVNKQINTLYKQFIYHELKQGYKNLKLKDIENIEKKLKDEFIIIFKFDSDRYGQYIDLWTGNYAYQILYKRNPGEFEQWRYIGNSFHRKFRKRFKNPIIKNGCGRLKIYYKTPTENYTYIEN